MPVTTMGPSCVTPSMLRGQMMRANPQNSQCSLSNGCMAGRVTTEARHARTLMP